MIYILSPNNVPEMRLDAFCNTNFGSKEKVETCKLLAFTAAK
jgi:hypothetical protein